MKMGYRVGRVRIQARSAGECIPGRPFIPCTRRRFGLPFRSSIVPRGVFRAIGHAAETAPILMKMGACGRSGLVGASLVGARFVSRRPLALGDRAPTRGAPTANHGPGFSWQPEAPASEFPIGHSNRFTRWRFGLVFRGFGASVRSSVSAPGNARSKPIRRRSAQPSNGSSRPRFRSKKRSIEANPGRPQSTFSARTKPILESVPKVLDNKDLRRDLGSVGRRERTQIGGGARRAERSGREELGGAVSDSFSRHPSTRFPREGSQLSQGEGGGRSRAGLPSKKPSGRSMKPTEATGMTGQSSKRGTWVWPKVYQRTRSRSAMSRLA
ncbi:hypothetical protein BSF38_05459 [Paludisphaera borealis]|uniref:Uncharacterized protein n=1 Tax=Paludisphaera borealis TaxID=1387353 RepID=A0A1U7CYA7_9BACT|nr:hypothetical protein BSF38_05459 [Paludisphaera borealis]